MEPTNIQVKAELIEKNIHELSLIGSSFCNQYFKPSKEQCDKNFAQRTIEAQSNGTLFLNRPIQRVKITGVPVLKLEYGQIEDEDKVMPVVYINRDMKKVVGNQEFDQSATCMIGENNSIFCDSNLDEAFSAAIKGEQKIFANPSEIAKKAKILNEAYLTEVRNLIAYLKDKETLLINTINSNENVVKRYLELRAKAVSPKDSVTITVEEN